MMTKESDDDDPGEFVSAAPAKETGMVRQPAGFEPANLNEAMTLARTLADSSLIPDALKGKPSDVFVILVSGHELGLSPMQALRGLAVIKGRPCLSADLMVALCNRQPEICKFFRFVQGDDKSATYETHRVGHPQPIQMTFTIDQAKAAGLVSKDIWRAYPAAMLRARAASALARAVYPDLLLGVSETDEADEIRGQPAPLRSVGAVGEVGEVAAVYDIEERRPAPAVTPIPIPLVIDVESRPSIGTAVPSKPNVASAPSAHAPARDAEDPEGVAADIIAGIKAAKTDEQLIAAWRCPKWLPDGLRAEIKKAYSGQKAVIRTAVAVVEVKKVEATERIPGSDDE